MPEKSPTPPDTTVPLDSKPLVARSFLGINGGLLAHGSEDNDV
jgi:hypothetical protein